MKEETLDKINKRFYFFIWATLIIAISVEVYYERWLTLFITILALILTASPKLFEKRYNIDIPTEFEIVIVFFIYLAIYLGEVHNFYLRFWWWDLFLHGISAITLGLIGFIIMIYLYQGNKIKAKPLLLCLFAFSFAIAFGAIWEIFEFTMDQFFNLNMQKSGLIDTMGDLIMDSIGALIASILGYIYLKNKESKLAFSIKSFIRKNPKLFGRIK